MSYIRSRGRAPARPTMTDIHACGKGTAAERYVKDVVPYKSGDTSTKTHLNGERMSCIRRGQAPARPAMTGIYACGKGTAAERDVKDAVPYKSGDTSTKTRLNGERMSCLRRRRAPARPAMTGIYACGKGTAAERDVKDAVPYKSGDTSTKTRLNGERMSCLRRGRAPARPAIAFYCIFKDYRYICRTKRKGQLIDNGEAG